MLAHQCRRIESIQRYIPCEFDVDFPIFDGRTHVDEVGFLTGIAEFRKRLRVDCSHSHGDFLSVFTSRSTRAGAELGSQAAPSQVFTPKRGSIHTCKMIQATKKPRGMSISIALPLFVIGFTR